MERVLSPDEKIRRAEEIYRRKKINAPYQGGANTEGENTDYMLLLKKLMIQTSVCVAVFFVVYFLRMSGHEVATDITYRVQGVLSESADLEGLYLRGMALLEEWGVLVPEETEGEVDQYENVDEEVYNEYDGEEYESEPELEAEGGVIKYDSGGLQRNGT